MANHAQITLLFNFYSMKNYIQTWKQVVHGEIKALANNGTWIIQSYLRGKKTFELKWAFMVKHKANGSIERLKSHLVAKSFTQSLWNQLSG